MGTSDGQSEHTIAVVGVGSVGVAPDIAEVTIGVEVTRSGAKDARDAAATAMTAVVAAAKRVGVADQDIRTDNLSLSPVYDYNRGSKLTGYQFSNTLLLTVREMGKLATVIDECAAIGATVIRGVSFRVDDPATAEAAARELAMKNARSRAEALAALAGVSIKGVASIDETAGGSPGPRPEMAMMRAVAAAPTPIEVGSSQISIAVAVRYLIG
jgi:hypothetical protein